jgi:hypothetical protein
MTPDDDIESMWMEIRPVRLPPAEVPAPSKVPSSTHMFTNIIGLIGAAAFHGTQCHGVFTSVRFRLAFQCSCGVSFEIEVPNVRGDSSVLIIKYLNTTSKRVATAVRLTHEPHEILRELERFR